ncbi:MAG: hypothetical protein QOE10_507 [Gaiellales bacterium]|nr:hypothetical protein [Gaiellales bacterium]
MNASQGSSTTRIVVALAATVACLALLAGASGALAAGASKRAGAAACTVVSPGRLASILGLTQSQVLTDDGAATPTSSVLHSECGVGVWSGPTPMTPAAVLQAGRSGHGAQVGILTWAPHDGSPNVKDWLKTGYARLTSGFVKTATLFPGVFTNAGWPTRSFTPLNIHHHTAHGFAVTPQGRATGLVAAIACWWEDKTSSAICIFDEEAASRPVVKHLNQLAAVAVPKFLG